MKQNICICAIGALALSLACGKNNNGGGNNIPGNVTITGQLQSGSVTHITETRTDGLATRTDALSGPLAGYILYCVTFATPAVAGSGTADSSGNVSVTL